MSCGELLCFGAACPASGTLQHLPADLLSSTPSLLSRDANKLCLQPGGAAAGCQAVSALVSASLLLLEDGQVVDLDQFADYESWVHDAFDELNTRRLPIVQLVEGGTRALPAAGSKPSLAQRASGQAGSFFLALTQDGHVLVTGRNGFGQLGLGHVRDVLSFVVLEKFSPAAEKSADIAASARSPLPARIVQLAAGRAHSLALTAEGSVYSWGSDTDGACGLTLASAASSAPSARGRPVEPLPRFLSRLASVEVASVVAHGSASVALDREGRAFGWGQGAWALASPFEIGFDSGSPPAIVSASLGAMHALFLDSAGRAWGTGVTIHGALGPVGVDEGKTIDVARRIPLPSEDDNEEQTVVSLAAGNYSSALTDSHGRVWALGSGHNDKFGAGGASEQHFAPSLLPLSGRGASMISLSSRRTLVFAPLRLHGISTKILCSGGGTTLTLQAQGLTPSPLQQVVVSFARGGVSTLSRDARYDPASNSVSLSIPPLGGKGERVLVRVSVDSGRHWSNALGAFVFESPRFALASASASSKAASRSLSPSSGPTTGGTALAIPGGFDLVPYERVHVRFSLTPSDPSVGGGAVVVVGTDENASFDPVHSLVRCTVPPVRGELFPPSNPGGLASAAAQAQGKNSKIKLTRPAIVLPRASLLPLRVEVSLDGGCVWFASPHPFCAYDARGTDLSPPSCALGGGVGVRFAVQGCHAASDESISVRFTVNAFEAQTVPGKFLSLTASRERGRSERLSFARAQRSVRQAGLERAARKAREEQEAFDAEEEARDPKERERLAKLAAAAEKKAAAGAGAGAAASSSSRPGSAESASRPRSSTPSGTRPISPAAGSRPTTASKAPQASAAVKDASVEAEDSSSSLSPAVAPLALEAQQDEFDVLEASIAAAEAAQDKLLALLSPQDRAAVGFVECVAPPFTRFGACKAHMSLSLNGGADFVALPFALGVEAPRIGALVPPCGPTSGGTAVRVEGAMFYPCTSISVKLDPLAPAPVAARPPSALEDPGKRASMTFKKPASSPLAAAAGAGRKDFPIPAAAAAADSPPVAPQVRVIDASYVVSPSRGEEASLAFVTPSWPVAGAAKTTVAFESSENAFSVTSAEFRFYTTPVVSEVYPLLVAQPGGTEVTLVGRGFINSGCIKVRLTLPDDDSDQKKGAGQKTAAASAAPTTPATPEADVAGVSSARKKLAAATQHAASIDDSALAESRRTRLPRIEVDGVYRANDSPEEEEAARKRKGAGKRAKDEAEPEAATITFLTPPAIAFNAEFADGSAINRALEVEVALNGQQFVPTGLLVRFEKDNKIAAKKPQQPAPAKKK